MIADKTLVAYSEDNAIAQVQAIFPESYVLCFGQSGDRYDVAVYNSKADFDADAEDGDNYRIKARYAVQAIDIVAELEEAIESLIDACSGLCVELDDDDEVQIYDDHARVTLPDPIATLEALKQLPAIDWSSSPESAFERIWGTITATGGYNA